MTERPEHCRGCGISEIDRDLEYTVDPFASEIHGDYSADFWCDQCLQERADEV